MSANRSDVVVIDSDSDDEHGRKRPRYIEFVAAESQPLASFPDNIDPDASIAGMMGLSSGLVAFDTDSDTVIDDMSDGSEASVADTVIDEASPHDDEDEGSHDDGEPKADIAENADVGELQAGGEEALPAVGHDEESNAGDNTTVGEDGVPMLSSAYGTADTPEEFEPFYYPLNDEHLYADDHIDMRYGRWSAHDLSIVGVDDNEVTPLLGVDDNEVTPLLDDSDDMIDDGRTRPVFITFWQSLACYHEEHLCAHRQRLYAQFIASMLTGVEWAPPMCALVSRWSIAASTQYCNAILEDNPQRPYKWGVTHKINERFVYYKKASVAWKRLIVCLLSDNAAYIGAMEGLMMDEGQSSDLCMNSLLGKGRGVSHGTPPHCLYLVLQ
jgi:hypothetical protein